MTCINVVILFQTDAVLLVNLLVAFFYLVAPCAQLATCFLSFALLLYELFNCIALVGQVDTVTSGCSC
jgi:hypothetical protein